MAKIVFIGLRKDGMASNIVGDCLLTPCLCDAEYVLVDKDESKLKVYERWLARLNDDINQGRATISATADRRRALRRADYVVTALSEGLADPYIVKDFEIPMKYGLRQTFADTVGVGGIFRGLRLIPEMMEVATDIMEICPNAWLFNYTDPMSIIVGALSHTGVKVVGLCHSVQSCVPDLLQGLGVSTQDVLWKIAGINHQAWLLEIAKNGFDIYPDIRERAMARPTPHDDMVRYDIMKKFGYYVTESSIHASEYMPYYIKKSYPELLSRFGVRTEMFRNWNEEFRILWEKMESESAGHNRLTHIRSDDYTSYIIEAMETNSLYKINANVINNNLISNLSKEAVVEVPCMIDGVGITPGYVGNIPTQLAALNQANINVHLLTIEAALTHRKEHIYHAALLDPHTSAELSADVIIKMCDELIEMNQPWLWDYE